MTTRVTRPLLAGDSKVYILNIRPQIDLNRFMSIFNTLRENLLASVCAKVITRHDVIFWIRGNPP